MTQTQTKPIRYFDLCEDVLAVNAETRTAWLTQANGGVNTGPAMYTDPDALARQWPELAESVVPVGFAGPR